MIPTLQISKDEVRFLDQRALPTEVRFVVCRDAASVAEAIKTMVVRGAPAIGVAAAAGIAVEARLVAGGAPADLKAAFDVLAQSRPTAVNLFWALDRMRRVWDSTEGQEPTRRADRLLDEATHIYDEDIAACRAMGDHGAELLERGARVLTHCNAGALATAGYGTALGVIRSAHRDGKIERVFADETRPFLQGARLTAWELLQDGIPTTLMTDSMAGFMMARGEITSVIVGADRIARNGDVVNKIGTYTVAILAREHQIPFYVAAPVSTFDLSAQSGASITIEERHESEVTHLGGVRVAPPGVDVRNPAFDITPHRYVTAIVCERGIARAPFETALLAFAGQSRS